MNSERVKKKISDLHCNRDVSSGFGMRKMNFANATSFTREGVSWVGKVYQWISSQENKNPLGVLPSGI